MSNPEAPDLTFDGMAVGDVFADSTIVVTADSIADFQRVIIMNDHGVASQNAGYAPPTMAAMWTVPRVMFREWNVPVGGIHARQRWQCARPIRAGSTLRVRITLKDKYVRKERPWVVLESRLTDLYGADVAHGEMTVVWPS